MSSLKQKTISGLSWSFVGNFTGKVVAFVIGIILARLLNPREYGLIGMVTIFTILTQPFVNSGFSQALIRKKHCTETEFSTVFYFNLFAGILFYGLIFLSAPFISSFFKEPELTKITRVIGLIIIIDAVTIIHTTILTREVNFKLQTKIDLASFIISGLIAIFLAFRGFGVWSLVYRELINRSLRSILLWFNNKWLPQKVFSLPVLKELFGFSSKLLASSVLDKIYYNIYNLVIAKFFSAKELGLYTRAKMFKDMIAQSLSDIVGRVSFPVFASIRDEPERLRDNYKKIYTSINFIVWIALFILAAIAEPLVITLIGEQWLDSVIYLQLLCFVGVFYPVHELTKNILFVFGKSGLYLRLVILSKIITIPSIFIGIIFGIKYMIITMIISGLIMFLLKIRYTGRLIGYPVMQHLTDLLPTLLLSSGIGLILFLINEFSHTAYYFTLIIQVFAAGILLIFCSEIFKFREYLYIKEVFLNQLNVVFKKKS